jgi:pyridine nucleotide-disulfide oxidoreductase family protein
LSPLAGANVTVVAPAASLVYSGMLPGWVAGHYTLDQCRVPIEALAKAAGATFVQRLVAAVDRVRRRVELVNGEGVDYDVLSIAVGSAIGMRSLPGAQAHAIVVRPLERFAEQWLELRRRLEAAHRAHVVVIGAGAGGVELALAAHRALARTRDVRITIVSAAAALPGRSGPRLLRRLHAAGIVVHNGFTAVGIDERSVHLAGGTALPADAAIVATGSTAPEWLTMSGLPVDDEGYLRVTSTLRVVAHDAIFAAGDCASIEDHPQPRSGVHALRMGPTLLENLRRSVDGGPLVTYTPRRRALHLMSAGDRYAIGDWGGVAFEGRWVWHLKDRIDRAFIARHTPGTFTG